MTIVSLNAPYQENRGHIAAVGIIGACAIGLVKLRMKLSAAGPIKNIPYVIFGITLVLYSTGTVMSNMVWKDDLTLWSNVSEKYPQSDDARIAMDLAHIRSEDLDTAESKIQTILKMNPRDSHALTNLGVISYRRLELDKALDYLLRAKDVDPFDRTVNVYLAKIYKDKGNMPSTAKQLLLLIALSPNNIPAYQDLVEVYAKMGEMEKVYNMMVRTIEKDPNNPGAHRALGLIHMYSGRLGQAQAAFEKALSAAPYNQDVILDLGYTYAKQGMFDQAGEMFKRVISLSPDDPEASQALANVYQRQGRPDEALAIYQSVLDKNPEQFNSYTNLGLLYFSKRDTVSAIDALGKALILNPNDYAARFNLARVYESQGKKELARKELQGVLMRTSGNNQNRKIYEVAQKKLADLK
jgi:tetratricopeptide (TPR) repeat protein